MSAIEASLRLEIAQYQQQLAKATGAVQKFKEDARANSKDMGRAIMGPPDSWALSASHRSALRSSLTGAGQEGGECSAAASCPAWAALRGQRHSRPA